MTDFVADLFDLSGRTALVTGASSGIGRHAAAVFAQAGAKVVLVARREDVLATVAGEIASSGGLAASVAWDVGELDTLDDLAMAAERPFGAPTIVFNAAGVNPRKPADDITIADWNDTLALNLSAPFVLSRALVPGMRSVGVGNIINVASLQTSRAFKNGIAYGAAKGSQPTEASGALLVLAHGVVDRGAVDVGPQQIEEQQLAVAWSGQASGIVANAIAPGFFPTELTEPVFSDRAMSDHHAAMTCIGRNGEMRDLDGALVFLASRACAYITGQILPVDGGYTAK